MENEDYMQIALDEAKKAYKKNEVPVGAIIVDDCGKIIGRGFNKKEKNKSVCAHAEILAITRACKKKKNWRLNNCSIYSTLEPCPMCASAIEQSRIKQVIYGASRQDDSNYKIIAQILSNAKIRKNVRKNDCANLLTQFFKQKR